MASVVEVGSAAAFAEQAVAWLAARIGEAVAQRGVAVGARLQQSR
jgi:hypothetical protein